MDFIQPHWLLLALALIVALLVAVWLFGRATRKPTGDRHYRPDVLDEGAAPAQRNQALIDAPSATAAIIPAVAPPTTVDTMGGLGEIIAVGARDEEVDFEARREEATFAEDAPAQSAASQPADDLGKLKGVGPKLVTALQAMGVTRFAQIAGWTDADISRVDAALPPAFQGRIARDNWVEQARFLAGGDVAGYEAKFGKL